MTAAGVYCAIHAKGLRQAPADDIRACQRCKGRIKKGIWFIELSTGGVEHVKNCRKNDAT